MQEQPTSTPDESPRDSRTRRYRRVSVFDDHVTAHMRPGQDRPRAWLRYAAIVRLALLAVVAAGAFLIFEPGQTGAGFLLVYYLFGFVTSIGYLIALQRREGVPTLLTWGQVLVDLAVVAATVALTGGPTSFFTFLFVVVILEATLLIGIADGFIYATLATVFMVMETLIGPSVDLPAVLWYSLLVETLAFYLPAAISGFWNLRLRRLQQFQLEVLDHLNNGFLITDGKGVIVSVNKAGETILGLKSNTAIGRPVQEVLRMSSGGECPVISAIRSERDFTSYEFQAALDDGESKLLGLTTSRIYDTKGQLTGVIASFSDLTEMDRMRRDLRRQDRLAVVGELAAGLAHEIRNPLAAIRGAVDELHANIQQPAMADRLAKIAIRESDQLNQIVTGFLDFARKPDLRREQFDMVELAQEVAESLRRKFAGYDAVTVELDEPDSPIVISADRSQLKQVFFNIGKNGIEAMEMNGTLTMSVDRDRSSVEIQFDDAGPGIEPDEVARIFEPFYTTKDDGVGMGLAVCQRIVTAHDGTLRASAREGGGASMIVRLPLGSAEE